MSKLIKTLSLTMLLVAVAFGQASLSTTTLGAAVSTTNATSITLASTSTMLSSGPANQINTFLWVDRELMAVTTVVDSTHVTVRRAAGVGAGGRPTLHANGAKVYFSLTTSQAPAGNYFSNGSVVSEVAGGCTSTSEFVLPKIYVFSGNIYDCKSGGQWVLVGNGSMGVIGTRVAAFCTGTVGSSQTNYANFAACSGATAATGRMVMSRTGTLANYYVYSSTAVTGGSSLDVATVYKNGSATTLTCTISAAGTTCSDTTHSVSVVPGDVITFAFATASGDTAANISHGVSIY